MKGIMKVDLISNCDKSSWKRWTGVRRFSEMGTNAYLSGRYGRGLRKVGGRRKKNGEK